MKRIMAITKCSLISILFLLLLFYQESSCSKKALNNGKNNYGLNDDELGAILFGLNYDSIAKNKDNLEKRKNVENESIFLRNFANEDTSNNTQSEKTQKEIETESVNSNKKEVATSEKNHISNENLSVKNEKVELKNDELLGGNFDKDKVNKKGDNTSTTNNDDLTNSSGKQSVDIRESQNINNYIQKTGDTNIEKSESLQKDVNIKNHNEETNDAKRLDSRQTNSEKSKISKDTIDKSVQSNEFTKLAINRLDKKENELKSANLEKNQNAKKDLLENAPQREDGKKITHPENSKSDEYGVNVSLNNEEVKNTNTKSVSNSEDHTVSYSEEKFGTHVANSPKGMLKIIKPVQFHESVYSKLNDGSPEYDENSILNGINENNENIFSEKITLRKGAKDRNEYEYFKLKSNDFKVLGIINKYSSRGGFSISVDCGGYDDFDEVPGISNLLKHAIFYKSEKRNTTLLSELGKYSSKYNSYISESFTSYYATAHSEDIYHLLNLFAENLFYPVFSEEHIQNEVKEINNKYISMENSPEYCLKIASQYITDFKYSKFFVNGNYTTLCENVLKNRLSIKNILAEFHKKCYQPRNMSLTILLGNKVNTADHYNMKDVENMVVHIFGKIKNESYPIGGEGIEKQINRMESERVNSNGKKDSYNDANFIYMEGRNEKEAVFLQYMNELHYSLDLNQKTRYVEILKKEKWGDQLYLYWSSRTNAELCKKIEEFGSMSFLREIFSDFRRKGFYYKISVENKYVYDLEVTSICNKYYLNFGILVKLTQSGKSNLAHLIHICNVFVNEISKLFDRDSLDKGISKYILDYYREKALVTDLNFNSDNVNVSLNDLVIYSNRLLLHADDPSSLLTINSLIEDKYKNDFRNHIKITSLLGSLIRNDNLNIINVVDVFSLTDQSEIPNTTITYALGENPYLVGEGRVTNDVNIALPEIKVCPFNNFDHNNVLHEESFFCVPYSNRENFEFSDTKPMFVSEENKNKFRDNVLYSMPCLIKSSYGYNVYFKKGLTDASKVKADFVFYFPSEKFTFYEAIFSRIHIIILRKKIKLFLTDYASCSINVHIKHNAESYTVHVDSNSYYFAELISKLGDLLSVKETPSKEEFADAYDELSMYVRSSRELGAANSLKIMNSLFNQYDPTDKEMDDLLSAYFFYPSYKDYTKYVVDFFHRNYVSIFIYGNIAMTTEKENENATSYTDQNADNGGRGVPNSSSHVNVKDNTNASVNGNADQHRSSLMLYTEANNKGSVSQWEERDNRLQAHEKLGEQAFAAASVQISHNGVGIEYLVNLSESFIKKVTNGAVRRSESTYYTSKLVHNEDVEINIPNMSQNRSSSIIVSYTIESESLLSDVLINIIVDLISSDFVKVSKLRYNDGYMVEVKPFFTRYGLSGLLFVIQSFDKDVEKLEAHICTFVKYVIFQLMNIGMSDMVKKLESMKEYYIINNTIFTFDQEYASITDQLASGMECFDKKYKIIKIFDELINCPKIILNKMNDILKNSKKAIFKEYKEVHESSGKSDQVENTNSYMCNYSRKAPPKLSSVQLAANSRLAKKNKPKERTLRNDTFRMNKLHKKENFINVSNFVEIKREGFFQYVMDYFSSNVNSPLNDSNYLDFKSCDEEMSKRNFHVFYNFANDINKIREYFLLMFSSDKKIREKCSVDYEEIRQYCSEY
ncbi:petidase, M16 family, putative [Plasmodium knowlesi strain H]|uniref:Petidase, M16 family, putative n=3 Tax=Plasmodium knowlesi TaxID=5850 RepID=A0A5E7X1C0_PLAKH|nr:peptidase M16, putative [Plasmodium knowlesi strain H]OTN65237.1 putative peptidase - M16 family [Plasmodium knowlesi]CAA9988242.1 peptidase M16, putative [Plasmodium knowlesi strain H]SBO20173.1 petidase, M16 family, putative [Plasmodium knowlesi strain H]SBO20521.1 petidase, M16 family, putative [Plasmodium knowlesi strain H]VVS77716.1 peptidase M16, putative [Plasmodium knowlesi strain H]